MPCHCSKSGQSPFLLLNLLLSAADCPFSTWSILFFVTALGLLGIKFLILVTSHACSFGEIHFSAKVCEISCWCQGERSYIFSTLSGLDLVERVLGVCTFHYDSHCDQDHWHQHTVCDCFMARHWEPGPRSRRTGDPDARSISYLEGQWLSWESRQIDMKVQTLPMILQEYWARVCSITCIAIPPQAQASR